MVKWTVAGERVSGRVVRGSIKHPKVAHMATNTLPNPRIGFLDNITTNRLEGAMNQGCFKKLKRDVRMF